MASTMNNRPVFPIKLHMLLSEAETKGYSDILSWLPDGKSFKVHNKEKFETEILPYAFETSKYRSFQKNLNVWGFESSRKPVQSENGEGVCSHPLFVRGCMYLCHRMVRRGRRTSVSQQDHVLGSKEEDTRNEGGEEKKSSAKRSVVSRFNPIIGRDDEKKLSPNTTKKHLHTTSTRSPVSISGEKEAKRADTASSDSSGVRSQKHIDRCGSHQKTQHDFCAIPPQLLSNKYPAQQQEHNTNKDDIHDDKAVGEGYSMLPSASLPRLPGLPAPLPSSHPSASQDITSTIAIYGGSKPNAALPVNMQNVVNRHGIPPPQQQHYQPHVDHILPQQPAMFNNNTTMPALNNNDINPRNQNNTHQPPEEEAAMSVFNRHPSAWQLGNTSPVCTPHQDQSFLEIMNQQSSRQGNRITNEETVGLRQVPPLLQLRERQLSTLSFSSRSFLAGTLPGMLQPDRGSSLHDTTPTALTNLTAIEASSQSSHHNNNSQQKNAAGLATTQEQYRWSFGRADAINDGANPPAATLLAAPPQLSSAPSHHGAIGTTTMPPSLAGAGSVGGVVYAFLQNYPPQQRDYMHRISQELFHLERQQHEIEQHQNVLLQQKLLDIQSRRMSIKTELHRLQSMTATSNIMSTTSTIAGRQGAPDGSACTQMDNAEKRM